VLAFLTLLDHLFANLALCCVTEASDGMGTGLVSRDELLAVRALHVFVTLLIVHTRLLLLCHKLLLAA